jgi:hypothetical protein
MAAAVHLLSQHVLYFIFQFHTDEKQQANKVRKCTCLNILQRMVATDKELHLSLGSNCALSKA